VVVDDRGGRAEAVSACWYWLLSVVPISVHAAFGLSFETHPLAPLAD
jgi:hypothetical protein